MKINKYLLIYNIKLQTGHFMQLFWSVLFPIFMAVIVTKFQLENVPAAFLDDVKTKVTISISLIIPMTIFFINYGINESYIKDRCIDLRMRLFGVSSSADLAAKVISIYIFLLFSWAAYFFSLYFIVGYQLPTLQGFLVYILIVSIVGIFYSFLGQGIVYLTNSVASANAVIMALYFLILLVSGIFGVDVNKFPGWLQDVSKIFPYSYLAKNDVLDIWYWKGYDYHNLFYSCLAFGALTTVFLLLTKKKAVRS